MERQFRNGVLGSMGLLELWLHDSGEILAFRSSSYSCWCGDCSCSPGLALAPFITRLYHFDVEGCFSFEYVA